LRGLFSRPRRLGARLIRAGAIERWQLREALDRQRREGGRLGASLIALGHIQEEGLAAFLSEQFGVPAIILHTKAIDSEAVRLLNMDDLERMEAVPVARAGGALTVAMADPLDVETIQEIEARLSVKVNPVVACQSAIRKSLLKQRIKANLPEAIQASTEQEREELGGFFAELDDYKVIAELGEGGFGKVYKCLQRSLDRLVAVKTLSRSRVDDKEVLERFRREGKITGRLSHLNIVRIFDQGEIDDILYMVMEYVEGRPLDEYLEGKSFDDRLDLIIQLCDAVAYAHSQGVLHRDLKPSNILVDASGLARLLDFGIALLKEPSRAAGGKSERLTQPRVSMGTPRYMSPEQRADFLNIDERSDLYSIGVIMFEVFTHSRLGGDGSMDPRALNPEIPEPLSQMIRRCLAERRDDRPASAAELRESLLRLRDGLAGDGRTTLDHCLRHGVAQNRDMLVKERYSFLSKLRDDERRLATLAEHKSLQRLVVVKKHTTKEGLAESKVLARVKHPHIAEILGVGEDASSCLIISEYLNGGSLGDRMKLGRLQQGERVLDHARDIVRALDFARDFRIAHGHLHPDNVLFAGDGTLKVTDFAVRPDCDPAMERFFRNDNNPAMKALSDPFQSDLFSVGVLLYEMLSGRRFNPVKDLDEQYERLRDVRVYPGHLRKVLRRLWRLAPESELYADTKALLRDLGSDKADEERDRRTSASSAKRGVRRSVVKRGNSSALWVTAAWIAGVVAAGMVAWGIVWLLLRGRS